MLAASEASMRTSDEIYRAAAGKRSRPGNGSNVPALIVVAPV